ncbi:MAG: tRNA (adenosine(37)-N6)-threonylcarbamoyltransferase complex transferase subunit TsaD [Patescibacteria group bacterium]
MKILAVETSCDETAIALLEVSRGLKNPKFKIIENLVASQIKIHQPYGGVVPNLAKREHLRNLPLLWQKIMNSEIGIKGKIKNKKTITHNSKSIIPDIIAVTVGPGLEPALWTGINFAKDLAKKLKKPIIGVSHLEGHLYSFLLQQKDTKKNTKKNKSGKQKIKVKKIFPAIALIVSGGHTILLLMKDESHYKKLGETRDDAIGEAFDKVARLLKLSYPGGPEIERLAKLGDSKAIDFPRPMINQKNYDFSFSGLKTAVLYYLRDQKNTKLNDVAASFQASAFDVVIAKAIRAAKEFKAESIMVSGGVAANQELKKEFKLAIKDKFSKKEAPELIITKFPTDNAAMIAAAAYFNHLNKKKRRLVAQGSLSL